MDKYFEIKFYTELISIGISVIGILFFFIISIIQKVMQKKEKDTEDKR